MSKVSMAEHQNDEPDPVDASEVVVTVEEAGIHLRKVTTYRGPEAVAITFTIRSWFEDRCQIRVIDSVPPPLQGNEVEFHPNYDPENWTRSGDSLVYETELPANGNRTTAYGVLIDARDQLELFDSEPVIEIDRPNADPVDGDSFTFESPDSEGLFDSEPRGRSTNRESPRGDASPSNDLAAPVHGSEAAKVETVDREEGRLVEGFVAELSRRELSEAERRAIREALDLDQGHPHESGTEPLEVQVETLQEEIEELRRAVERERAWRRELRDSLSFEPDTE